MSYDAHANLAYSTVATAPSPASSGTSLVVATGDGSRFPAVSFNALVWPIGAIATPANSEIVRVTNISSDTLTITRAQESTSARSIIVGDQIAATATAKTFTDIEANTRERLTANRTYYVRTDGSDSNTGLANTAGGAFLTIQKAIDTIGSKVDLGGFNVTIQLATGTYTGSIVVNAPWVGAGTVTLLGDTITPSNVLLSCTNANCLMLANGATLYIGGVKIITSTAGSAIIVAYSAMLYVNGKIEFGACANVHFLVQFGGHVLITTPYTVSGGGYCHYDVEQGATLEIYNVTITVSGTPAFSYFALANNMGIIQPFGCTYSGSATGTRYLTQLNSLIQTGSGGANYFPGNSAGSTATGGQYV